MKGIKQLLLWGVITALLWLTAFPVTAEQPPVLTSIAFKNGIINEAYSPDTYEYTLTLDDPTMPPTLKDFTVSGNGRLFINYETDEAKHQTGVTATLEYESGSTIYTFRYTNAQVFGKSDNFFLKELYGDYTEVIPALNENQTRYRLYIPADTTVLRLMAVTQDISAYCDIPGEILLSPEQEPSLLVTVTASDGSSRVYTFDIRRSELTEDEVRTRKAQGDFTYADELLFFRKPAFKIAAVCAVAGVVLLILLMHMLKRLTVRAVDGDEVEFFDMTN